MKRASVLSFAVLLFAAAAVARPRAQSQTNGSKDKMALAVTAVRAINTAEARFLDSNHRYGTFQELVTSGQLANLHRLINAVHNTPAVNINASSEEDAVSGYKTQLIIAGSGNSYSLILRDATNSCDAAFFSDDRGIIFRGQAMGCDNSQ